MRSACVGCLALLQRRRYEKCMCWLSCTVTEEEV